MPKLFNRAKVSTATTGTGAVVLGAAVAGYQSFAAAGIANGDVVHYLIEDGSAWEFGYGTYTSAGTSLARTQILGSSNAGSAINLSGNGIVSCVPFAESLRGRQAIWLPAGAMTPRISNGAARGTAELATNKIMAVTLDFDAVTPEFAQFDINLPPSYNGGSFTYYPVWSHAATATNFNVSWKLAGRCYSLSDALDQAFGTAIEVADTGGTTNVIYTGDLSAALTLAGTPAGGRYSVWQIQRDPDDPQDNMAIDARLHGVMLFYSTNTPVED